MYKLLLCLRYVARRPIGYLAIVGVWLCVSMLIVVTSVMDGFMQKIEVAAKGLFGDVILEPAGQEGLAYYDELIERIRQRVPEVEAGEPFILSYGILRVPGQPHYREPVQVAGIRLPGREKVSDFEKGLHFQRGRPPTWDPPRKLLLERLAEERARTEGMLAEYTTGGKTLGPRQQDLIDRLGVALSLQQRAAFLVQNAEDFREDIQRLQEAARKAEEDGDYEKVDSLLARIDQLKQESFEPPADRVILGLGIQGLSRRTEDGEVIRYLVPGHKVMLYIFPLGRTMSMTDFSPNQQLFSVIDDCRTGVYSIDTGFVYVPLETLQKLNNMEAELDPDDPNKVLRPARCSQIHIRVRKSRADERELNRIAGKIQGVWAEFRKEHPNAAMTEMYVQTWRQRQAKLIGQIESQRVIQIIILAFISVVAVVLIFAILYTISVQKTRDVGVLKALGASGGGVSAVFLGYGAIQGFLGSVLGTATGWLFMRHINDIRDWLSESFGFTPYSREYFLFDELPTEVMPATAAVILAAAMGAGVLGAVIPAVRAAIIQPVEALRYE